MVQYRTRAILLDKDYSNVAYYDSLFRIRDRKHIKPNEMCYYLLYLLYLALQPPHYPTIFPLKSDLFRMYMALSDAMNVTCPMSSNL